MAEGDGGVRGSWGRGRWPKERQVDTRRMSLPEFIQTLAAGLAIAMATAGTAGAVLDWFPFLKKSVYAADQKVADERLEVVEADDRTLKTTIASVQRSNLLSLQIQLQERIDHLTDILSLQVKGSDAYREIRSEIDTDQQQLDEVKRSLDGRGGGGP